jgi:hypothetical protein
MRYGLLFLILAFSYPIYAGGSWGGGTPPASRLEASDLDGASEALVDHSSESLLMLENVQLTLEEDGGYLLTVSASSMRRLLSQAKREGSVAVQTGYGKKFTFWPWHDELRDFENVTRIVMRTDDDAL